MICASFGIKLFSDRDLLLTENCKLVHYGNGTRGSSTLGSPTNVYFYILDEKECIERNDENYVSNVVELSNIPIYRGNNPKFSLWEYDFMRQELIENSELCIYYYHVNSSISFFLHYKYKGEIHECELDGRVQSLLKYTWFSTQQFSLDEFEKIVENTISKIVKLDTKSIINDLYITSGHKTFYGRDSETTDYGERLIINTQDPYILTTLFKQYPQPRLGISTTYMYGEEGAEKYERIYETSLSNKIMMQILGSIIDNETNAHDCRKCIKYIIIRYRYLDLRNFDLREPQSIQCCNFDYESIMTDKSNTIKQHFLESYTKEKHIGGIIYFLMKAVTVPNELYIPVIKEYLQWRFDDVRSSNLRYLTIYWSAKAICFEFNKRSNDKFKFNLDFTKFN